MEAIKKGVLSKLPLLGPIMLNVSFEPSEYAQIAETDGVKVFYSPSYFSKLTFEEKICVFAHELLHITFDHILRCKDKDKEIWNYATDAVINQMLKSMGLPLPSGTIDIPEASGKSAEEMYNILLERKDELDQVKKPKHKLWDESAKSQDLPNRKNQQENINEKKFLKQNEEFKKAIANEFKEKLNKKKKEIQVENKLLKTTLQIDDEKAQTKISWQKILKKELAENVDGWSYRRANEDNDYQARIESMEIDNKINVELMLDTSGSVKIELLREFLKQIKTLLNEARLKVGCFDVKFYGFTTIKNTSDIDNFEIYGRGGTNFDVALASFSQKKEVFKLIFTDGYDKVTRNAVNEKIRNLYWLVWENKSFNPCCGKVIFVENKLECFQTKLKTCMLKPQREHLKNVKDFLTLNNIEITK